MVRSFLIFVVFLHHIYKTYLYFYPFFDSRSQSGYDNLGPHPGVCHIYSLLRRIRDLHVSDLFAVVQSAYHHWARSKLFYKWCVLRDLNPRHPRCRLGTLTGLS